MSRSILGFGLSLGLVACAALTSPPEMVPDPGAPASNAGTGDDAKGPEQKTTPDPKLGLRRRFLVLPITSRTTAVSHQLTAPANENLRAAVGALPDLLLVPEDEFVSEGLVSESGDYQFRKIFAFCGAHGIAGVIATNLDDVATVESGDEIGIFRDRHQTTSVKVTLDVYDAASERKVFTRTVNAKADEDSLQLLEGPAETDAANAARGKTALVEAVKQLTLALPSATMRVSWFGHIARIQFNQFFITGGEQAGLKPGQFLKVLDPGSPIVDPATGEVLGLAPGRMKGLLKIVEPFGQNGSIAVMHSGAGFREHDRVELFIPPRRD